MTTRAQIIAEARTWLDTPFVHQGRLRRVGVDCIGLCVCPAIAAGIQGLPDVRDYSRQSHPDTALPILRSCMDEIAFADARLADVLCFWFDKPHLPQHYALLTDIGILHAYESVHTRCAPHGRVVETRLPIGWAGKVHSAWRFRGLEEAA